MDLPMAFDRFDLRHAGVATAYFLTLPVPRFSRKKCPKVVQTKIECMCKVLVEN